MLGRESSVIIDRRLPVTLSFGIKLNYDGGNNDGARGERDSGRLRYAWRIERMTPALGLRAPPDH